MFAQGASNSAVTVRPIAVFRRHTPSSRVFCANPDRLLRNEQQSRSNHVPSFLLTFAFLFFPPVPELKISALQLEGKPCLLYYY